MTDETTGPRRAQRREDRRRTRRTLTILGLLIAVLFAGVLGTVGWVLFSAQKAIDRSTNGHGGNVIEALLPGQAPASAVASGRLNVLIAGNSYDDPGHQGADLTDGIIVASVDLATHKGVLVSVPRDLWVQYKGSSMKINAVYPAGGTGIPGLTALGQVVEQVTGLHIDEHVLVGYAAVRGVVDAVGGIDVTINSPDPRGILDHGGALRLSNGPQHLDGTTAMQLASSRNDPIGNVKPYGLPYSDFSREQSQRLILSGIVTKVKTTPTLANPLTVVQLFDQLSQHIVTDMTTTQIRNAYDLTAKSGSPTDVSFKDLLTDYTAKPAGDALVPKAGMYDYTATKAFVASALAG